MAQNFTAEEIQIFEILVETVNHYEFLGVKTNASAAEIRSAYRQLALIYHPDKNDEQIQPAANIVFKKINDANETLSDPQQREIYNARFNNFSSSSSVALIESQTYARKVAMATSAAQFVFGLMFLASGNFVVSAMLISSAVNGGMDAAKKEDTDFNVNTYVMKSFTGGITGTISAVIPGSGWIVSAGVGAVSSGLNEVGNACAEGQPIELKKVATAAGFGAIAGLVSIPIKMGKDHVLQKLISEAEPLVSMPAAAIAGGASGAVNAGISHAIQKKWEGKPIITKELGEALLLGGVIGSTTEAARNYEQNTRYTDLKNAHEKDQAQAKKEYDEKIAKIKADQDAADKKYLEDKLDHDKATQAKEDYDKKTADNNAAKQAAQDKYNAQVENYNLQRQNTINNFKNKFPSKQYTSYTFKDAQGNVLTLDQAAALHADGNTVSYKIHFRHRHGFHHEDRRETGTLPGASLPPKPNLDLPVFDKLPEPPAPGAEPLPPQPPKLEPFNFGSAPKAPSLPLHNERISVPRYSELDLPVSLVSPFLKIILDKLTLINKYLTQQEKKLGASFSTSYLFESQSTKLNEAGSSLWRQNKRYVEITKLCNNIRGLKTFDKAIPDKSEIYKRIEVQFLISDVVKKIQESISHINEVVSLVTAQTYNPTVSDLLHTILDLYKLEKSLEETDRSVSEILSIIKGTASDKVFGDFLKEGDILSTPSEHLQLEVNQRGFDCRNVPGDGNCFYYALLDQLQHKKISSPQTVEGLHMMGVSSILENLEQFEHFIAGDIGDFLSAQLDHQKNPWADHIMILALSKALNLNIIILQSDHNPPTVIKTSEDAPVICLGYEVNVHYQSLIITDADRANTFIQDQLNNADISLGINFNPRPVANTIIDEGSQEADASSQNTAPQNDPSDDNIQPVASSSTGVNEHSSSAGSSDGVVPPEPTTAPVPILLSREELLRQQLDGHERARDGDTHTVMTNDTDTTSRFVAVEPRKIARKFRECIEDQMEGSYAKVDNQQEDRTLVIILNNQKGAVIKNTALLQTLQNLLEKDSYSVNENIISIPWGALNAGHVRHFKTQFLENENHLLYSGHHVAAALTTLSTTMFGGFEQTQRMVAAIQQRQDDTVTMFAGSSQRPG